MFIGEDRSEPLRTQRGKTHSARFARPLPYKGRGNSQDGGWGEFAGGGLYFPLSAACAAASRATGTLKGEQLT